MPDRSNGVRLTCHRAQTSLAIGGAVALVACAFTVAIFIPSTVSTVLQFRSGFIGSLRDCADSLGFRPLRVRQDTITLLFGAFFFGSVFSAVLLWSVIALIALSFFYEVSAFFLKCCRSHVSWSDPCVSVHAALLHLCCISVDWHCDHYLVEGVDSISAAVCLHRLVLPQETFGEQRHIGRLGMLESGIIDWLHSRSISQAISNCTFLHWESRCSLSGTRCWPSFCGQPRQLLSVFSQGSFDPRSGAFCGWIHSA